MGNGRISVDSTSLDSEDDFELMTTDCGEFAGRCLPENDDAGTERLPSMRPRYSRVISDHGFLSRDPVRRRALLRVRLYMSLWISLGRCGLRQSCACRFFGLAQFLLRLILPQVVEVSPCACRVNTIAAEEPEISMRIGPGGGAHARPCDIAGSRST